MLRLPFGPQHSGKEHERFAGRDPPRVASVRQDPNLVAPGVNLPYRLRFGLRASAEIAVKFPDATAIGFMVGKHSTNEARRGGWRFIELCASYG